MSVYDTQNELTRESALDAAAQAVRDGGLIVLPTDTVYGIGADAFTPDAVQDLLMAKGRGRDVPPPVLVGDPAVLHALAVDVPDSAEDLANAFWPGALTLILRAQPSLTWDLGETRGTVALRMPDDETALALLRRTGPLAVSSANRHGRPAALSVMDAATQLGDQVSIYLDGGPARIGTSSTIIDLTVEPPQIVREGALSKDEIIAAVGDIFAAPEPEPAEGSAPAPEGTTDPDAAGEAVDGAPAREADGGAESTDSESAGSESAGSEGTAAPAGADGTAGIDETAPADERPAAAAPAGGIGVDAFAIPSRTSIVPPDAGESEKPSA